jgi:hypothetical protein
MVPRDNISVSFEEVEPSIYQTRWETYYHFVAQVPSSCPGFRSLSNVLTETIPFSIFGADDNGTNPAATEFNAARLLRQANFWLLDSSSDAPKNWSGVGAAGNSPECPSLGFVYGVYHEFSRSPDSITAFLCSQGFQEVLTNVTFITSDMTISTRQPPVIDEASARWVALLESQEMGTFVDQTDNWSGWYFEEASYIFQLDNFFQSLLWGPGGILFEELVGPANEDKLFEAVQHQYRRYMAQVMNVNMRVPVTENTPVYIGALPGSNGNSRLVQHRISKIIHQVLLGIMLGCHVIIHPLFRKSRHVLPRCPWSLLGVMTLLARSELCTENILPSGAEFMSDKEMRAALNGWFLSLGWRGQVNHQRYGIDVGKSSQVSDNN